MTEKIASQMKAYFKLISLGQRQLLNKNSGCFKIYKTIQNYLRIPFKCSHILYGIVAYHIIRQTLVTGHVETVLLCRTVNSLVIQLHLHINFANEQMAKTRERCMHRPGERDFQTYAPVSCVCVQEVSSDRSKLSRIKSEICFVGVN